MQFIDHFLNNVQAVPAFLIEADQGDQGGAHYVVAFVYDGLLQVLFETLDIEVVNDLS